MALGFVRLSPAQRDQVLLVARRSAAPASVTRARALQRSIERWGAFLLYVALVVIHLFLDLTMSGPVIYPDEGAYVGTAHQLLSGTGLLYAHAPYHPGYSLLLLPIIRFFPDALRAYHAILILNALLLAGVGVAVFLLSRHLVPRENIGLRLVIAALVASYPAFLDYSNLMMSMNLFIPASVFLCVMLGMAFQRNRAGPWFICGAIGGFLYIIHPIGLAVVASLLAVGLLIRRARWLETMVALLLGLQLTLVPGLLVMHTIAHENSQLAKPLPLSKTAILGIAPHQVAGQPAAKAPTKPPPAPQSRVRDITQTFTRNLSGSRLANNLYALAGQTFYLVAGTYGLWILGMAVAFAAAWRVVFRGSETVADRVAVFIGLAMVLTLVSSALRFYAGRGGTGESDELIYGRYNELVVAPVLVLGAVGLSRLRSAPWRRLLAWPAACAAMLALTGWALYAGRSQAALHAVFVDVNVLALQPLLWWLGGVDVLPIALIAGGAVVAATLIVRRLGLVAVSVPIVAACILSASFTANRISRDSDGRTGQRMILTALHTIAERSGPLPHCVAYDTLIERVWHLSNDQFFLPTTKFRRFNSYGEQPCSDVVITGRLDLDLTYPGARMVTAENFSPTKLWVLPGARLARLAVDGLLLPSKFPAMLPNGAFHTRIRVVGLGPGTDVLPHGGGRELLLSVSHTGTAPPTAPWPSRYGSTSGDGWVRLAVVWVAGSNSLVPVAEASADLPRTVFPGETVNVRLHLIARDVNGVPLPPGNYFVRIGLVQEGFAFFTDKGEKTLDLKVSVAEPVGHH